MSNPFRNEITVVLNETEYVLRPTFSAMAEIEDHMKKTLLLTLSEVVAKAELTAKQIYTILAAGIKGAGNVVNKAQLESDIAQSGTIHATTQVANFLAAATHSSDLLKKN